MAQGGKDWTGAFSLILSGLCLSGASTSKATNAGVSLPCLLCALVCADTCHCLCPWVWRASLNKSPVYMNVCAQVSQCQTGLLQLVRASSVCPFPRILTGIRRQPQRECMACSESHRNCVAEPSSSTLGCPLWSCTWRKETCCIIGKLKDLRCKDSHKSKRLWDYDLKLGQ